MKRILASIMIAIIMFMICACDKADTKPDAQNNSKPTTSDNINKSELNTEENTETTTESMTEAATEAETPSGHSKYYIEGVSVDDIITYFSEVCLDAEYTYSGDATLVQKWTVPIRYTIHGDYTNEDMNVLNSFVSWLNTIESFPGIGPAASIGETNLDIHFCDEQGMLEIMGDDITEILDGRVTFWYDGNNSIYSATICYRTDIEQYTRNSVILEEIYNGLGPLQDTEIRTDSIIYSYFTTPQELTEIDKLILKLLYHPDIKCGMNKEQCETVIRSLYY